MQPLFLNGCRKQISIIKEKGIEAAKQFINEKVFKVPEMKLDYYEVCDANSLEPISEIQTNQKVITLIAVFVGNIRLIDNWMVE